MEATRNELATSDTSEPSGLTVKWSAEDMEGIKEAAKRLSEREHGDYTKTDIVRMGTRRFVAEVLAPEEGRRSEDRRAS